MPHITDVPRLLSHPREQYVRQNEARIADAIAQAFKSSPVDPAVHLHSAVVDMTQALIDVHDSAANRQRACGANRVADTHEGFSAQATQIKLYHLSQLASILL